MRCEADHYTGQVCLATLRWDGSCPAQRWHDDDHTDNDDETYARAAQREADLYAH